MPCVGTHTENNMSEEVCVPCLLKELKLSKANGPGPKAARLGDIGSGHGCFPPTPIVSASPDVFTNHRPAARLGDPLVPHGCGNCPPHGRSIGAGSANVFINNKKAARVGDSIGCGGSVSAGSGDVFIGETGVKGPEQACLKAAKASGAAFAQVSPVQPPPPAESVVTQPSEALRTTAQGGTPFIA
jgi:uncharacterized Zn-binding protein involved in type VI secretion